MFDSLRDAFRQAVRNFQTELNRDRVPEAADRLLSAMKRELAEARSRTQDLRSERTRILGGAEREESEARTCLRREEMARRIGDAETARIAREYAGRHLRKREVLTRKAEALELEIAEQERQLREMEMRLSEARVRRESLAATRGRTEARDRIERAGDLVGEVDRMEARVREMQARVDAAREVEAALDPQTQGVDGNGPDPQASELERRLEELKARMEAEEGGRS